MKKNNKELILFSFGDKQHEPTEEQMQKGINQIKSIPIFKEKYFPIVMPYWITAINFGKTKIKKGKIEDFIKPEKVYCNDCEHILWKENNYDTLIPWCKTQKVLVSSPIKDYNIMIRCEDRNANNNCPYYEKRKSFFEKLLR